MNKALQKGDIGEHICAICLLEMDVSCKIVNIGATDILATVGQKLIRIQVKGSHYKFRNDVKSGGTPFYRFSTALGKTKKRLTTAYKYALKRKEASKRKTKRMRKKK